MPSLSLEFTAAFDEPNDVGVDVPLACLDRGGAGDLTFELFAELTAGTNGVYLGPDLASFNSVLKNPGPEEVVTFGAAGFGIACMRAAGFGGAASERAVFDGTGFGTATSSGAVFGEASFGGTVFEVGPVDVAMFGGPG